MKKKIDQISDSRYLKAPRSLSRKHASKTKLPIISHIYSSHKLTSYKNPKPAPFEPQKRFSSGAHTPDISFSLYPKNKKTNITIDEDYLKLDTLSQKNNAMHSEYLSIQQRFIELASNSKLPTFKDISYSAVTSHRIISQADLILQKYHEDIKEKIKALGNANTT